MTSTQSQPYIAALAPQHNIANSVLASFRAGDDLLEISQKSLSRILNGNCDGVMVLMLDSRGYEYSRQFFPATVAQAYILGNFSGAQQYKLSSEILQEFRTPLH